VASEASGLSGIAERYAIALYELADEAKALDTLADDLRELRGMIAESGDFSRFLRTPLLGRKEQTDAVQAVLKAAGGSDLTRRFVGVLGRNRRLFALSATIEAFLEILAERRGEVTAHVTAAAALSDAQEAALLASLKKAIGGSVNIETKIEPELIGGLVVRVGSRMVDTSLRTKLQRMQLAMKGVG
jgi:F-type H+-transporting ATPase subunit delta